MKKLLLLPLALAFASNAAMAANSVDISVTGTITPGACSISLDTQQIDYASIDYSTLSPTESTSLPGVKQATVSILCSQPTLAGFIISDNREGTENSTVDADGYNNTTTTYGLGQDAQGNNIGGYTIHKMDNVTLDGGPGYWVHFNSGVWSSTGGGAIIQSTPTHVQSWSTAYGAGTKPPTPITSVSALLSIVASIGPTNDLDLSEEIELDGSATFELVYI
ncbi:DUF1120 domain-containing protein [Pseudomonas sp. NPDC098747]|uniref:DUF1120 domain-containing protein n=1 Tax=Pseudomonas sp. NPDC098747 TaxID=3364487 RepID=UPI00383BEEB2